MPDTDKHKCQSCEKEFTESELTRWTWIGRTKWEAVICGPCLDNWWVKSKPLVNLGLADVIFTKF